MEEGLQPSELSADGMIGRIMEQVDKMGPVTYEDAVANTCKLIGKRKERDVLYNKILTQLGLDDFAVDTQEYDDAITMLQHGDTKPARAFLSTLVSQVIGEDPVGNKAKPMLIIDRAADAVAWSLALKKGPTTG